MNDLSDNNCNTLILNNSKSCQIGAFGVVCYVTENDVHKTTFKNGNKTGINSDRNRSKFINSVKHLTLAESFAKKRKELCKYEIKIKFTNRNIPDFNNERSVFFGSKREEINEQNSKSKVETSGTYKNKNVKRKVLTKTMSKVGAGNYLSRKSTKKTKLVTNNNDDKFGKNTIDVSSAKSREEKEKSPEYSLPILNDVVNSDPFSMKNFKVAVIGSQKTITEKKVTLQTECNRTHLQETSFKNGNHGVSVCFNSNEPSQDNSFNESNKLKKREGFGEGLENCKGKFGAINLKKSKNITSPFSTEGISDAELKQRLKERLKKQKEQKFLQTEPSGEVRTNLVIPNSQEGNNSGQVTVDFNGCKSTSLQEILVKFLKNPELKKKNFNSLKSGICFSWLSNNFTCKKLSCCYCHDAYKLFKEKLQSYTPEVIISFVALMQNDVLFVDLIMAAINELSQRNKPETWISFLIFLVFFITEPSDIRFMKFWHNAARIFCQLSDNYAGANGFASLLSIFNDGDDLQKKKIVQFLIAIKRRPIQMSITFHLLEPVLNMDLPVELLTEALESCIESQKFSEVLNVYDTILPRIMEKTLTVDTVNILIKFCKVLKTVNENDGANYLKQRLNDQIKTMDIKDSECGYYNAALTRGKLANSLAEVDTVTFDDCFENHFQDKCNKKYFKLEEKHYCDLVEALLPNSVLCEPKEINNSSDLDRLEYDLEKEKDYCWVDQMTIIRAYLNICQFRALATYLNDLKGNAKQAAEEILRELFRKKMSLQEIVDLVNIMVMSCKTESAALVVASIGITFILHLAKISEWDKAYTVLTLYSAKKINLINGWVFYSNGLMDITQCRIALLLAEVYTHKENYKNAIELIKTHFLFSPNRSLYNLTWKEDDEKIRIGILEELLKKVTYNRSTEMAYDLFNLIWEGQNQLQGPLDLRRFADEVLTLLLNEGNNEALKIYDKMKSEIELKSYTVRAILIALVRGNQFKEAKSIPISLNQSVYFLPDVTSSAAVMVVSSFWLEEEIFIMFDTLFDLLILRKYNADESAFGKFDDYGVRIQISYSEESSFSSITPLCLGLLKPLHRNIYQRLELVLEQQFTPPLQLVILSNTIILEKYSLKRHLETRSLNQLN